MAFWRICGNNWHVVEGDHVRPGDVIGHCVNSCAAQSSSRADDRLGARTRHLRSRPLVSMWRSHRTALRLQVADRLRRYAIRAQCQLCPLERHWFWVQRTSTFPPSHQFRLSPARLSGSSWQLKNLWSRVCQMTRFSQGANFARRYGVAIVG